MSFPLSKPVVALFFLAIGTGAAVLFHPAPQRADLTLWVFAEPHARMYRGDLVSAKASAGNSLLQQFQNETGHSVRLDLIAMQAVDLRLMSAFMSENTSGAAPDLVEIEIGSIGKYFRAPADDVGFLPLNDYLEKSGWMNRLDRTRFAPWSKDSIIFGIPDDLHPCSLSYRKDLFDEAGVDLESAHTWPVFQSRCLQFQKYWHSKGRDRTAIGLSSTAADAIIILLQQQHINLIDSDLSIHLADVKVLRTLMWYAQAIAGENKIAADVNPAAGQDVRDLASGDICAMITPDWQIANLKQYGPDLAGKLHMIALPKFSEDDAPTASWGGTMIGITRKCEHPDLAWKLIEKLYLDRAAIAVRQESTNILPPIPEYWSDPIYQRPDPFFADQKVDQLYVSLAADLPRRDVTAYTNTAQTILAVILNRVATRLRNHEDSTLENECRQWLAGAATNLQEAITFDGMN